MLQGLGLGLWALVLLRASSDGRLDLLLRSVFHPLVTLAGFVLLVLTVAAVLQAMGGRNRPAPRRIQPRQLLVLSATALVAVLLLAIPPNPSFADLASQRPSDESAEAELAFVLPPGQRSLTDWVRLLRSQSDPRLFAGEPVRISGFVLPQPGGQPLLARLLVRCCLADATPVGLAVRWPPGKPLPQADQWLQLEGVMGVQAGPEGDALVVLPSRITPIARPARPLEP
jgi:uncharacterized repeat protein (TIGR03943 family)